MVVNGFAPLLAGCVKMNQLLIITYKMKVGHKF